MAVRAEGPNASASEQEQAVAVDREWLNAEIAQAVLNRDIDRLEQLADYAHRHDDEDTACDLHGRVIKPHRSRWAS